MNASLGLKCVQNRLDEAFGPSGVNNQPVSRRTIDLQGRDNPGSQQSQEEERPKAEEDESVTTAWRENPRR